MPTSPVFVQITLAGPDTGPFNVFASGSSGLYALDGLGINKVMVCRVNQWQPGQWVTIYTAIGDNWIKSGTSYDPKFELTSGL